MKRVIILVFAIFVVGVFSWKLRNKNEIEFENAEKMNIVGDNSVEENAQEKELIKGEEFNKIIKQIKEDYLKINNCEDCEIIEKDFAEKSTEGGEIFVYVKDNNLQKIVKKSYGEMGKVIYELYYREGVLFFVYIKFYEYNRPIYWDEEKVKEENLVNDEIFDINKSEIFEDRFYFVDDKLILWVDNDGHEIEAGKEFFEREKNILDMNDRTLNLYYN